MDLYGEPDEDDVRLRVRACLDLGLEDITIGEVDDTTLVGACWTDATVGPVPGTDESYRLVMMTGRRYDGECIILREEDWQGDFEAYCDREKNLTFQQVAEAVIYESAWREGFGALLDLGAGIEELIDSRARAWRSRFRSELGRVCADTDGIEADPHLNGVPDVEGAFEAFQAACRRRMPYCAGIEVAFKDENDVLPEVVFGHYPGAENQVLYRLTHSYGSTFMYLNGLETEPGSYEEDIAEHHQDPWARLGALGAGRDLIAIRDAAGNLLSETMRLVEALFHYEELNIQIGAHLGEPESEEYLKALRMTRKRRRESAFTAMLERVAAFLDQDELHDTEPAAAAG